MRGLVDAHVTAVTTDPSALEGWSASYVTARAVRHLLHVEADCSPGLRTAIGPHVRGLRDTIGPHAFLGGRSRPHQTTPWVPSTFPNTSPSTGMTGTCAT